MKNHRILQRFVVLIPLLIIVIAIYITSNDNNEVNNDVLNLNNDNNPKEIVTLLEIPTPYLIIFYHNGQQKFFLKGTDEYNEIIKLNNKRDSGKLGAMQLVVDIDGLLKNTDMLEYTYQNHNSVYFNLIKDEQLDKNNTETNWVSVGYDSKVFKQFIYSGLFSADEIINYLYSLK